MLRSLAGGAMFGETWGETPPELLVLHGWRRTHADFALAVGPDAPGGPVPTLAPDLPGFGATPAPPVAWGSADYAAAVARVLEVEAPVRPLVVAGHSLGGRVAVQLAAHRPDTVAALVLSGAPLVAGMGSRRRPPGAFRALRAAHRAHLIGDARMERARRRYGSEDYRAASGVLRDVLVRMVNEGYDDVLAAVRCPVELVWGDDDPEVPLEVAHAIAARVPNAVTTVCPGAGHFVPVTAPDVLRAAVERALARRPA
jgi:pimeloyl-ACP methyl ester carboxylesterase